MVKRAAPTGRLFFWQTFKCLLGDPPALKEEREMASGNRRGSFPLGWPGELRLGHFSRLSRIGMDPRLRQDLLLFTDQATKGGGEASLGPVAEILRQHSFTFHTS